MLPSFLDSMVALIARTSTDLPPDVRQAMALALQTEEPATRAGQRSRLFGGRTVIHVLADQRPGEGFEPMQGGLEDVYFSTLAVSRRNAA